MASKAPGLLQRAWASLRNAIFREQLMGTDAAGNRYYKWYETIEGVTQEKRRVKVPGNSILYDPKTVPPEWRMWLHKTRQDAPTEEEMARSAQRAAVMRARVAAIEQREAARRFRMQTLGQEAQDTGGPDMAKLAAQMGHAGAAQQGSHAAAGGASSFAAGGWRPGGAGAGQALEGGAPGQKPGQPAEPAGDRGAFKPGTWTPG